MRRAAMALLLIALAGFTLAQSAQAAQRKRHHGFSINTGPDKELRDCSQIRLTAEDAEILQSEQTKIIPQSSNSPLRIRAPRDGGIFIQGWNRNEFGVKACLGAAGDSTAEAKALLPVAAASASDVARADSLLFVYGRALVRVRDCRTAVRVFEGVIRRQRAVAVVESAREGLGLCALVEGQMALEQGHPEDAEAWFRRATAPGASTDVVRAAFLGLGDVRMSQGDVPGAMESYQQALLGGTPGDTISQRAQEKLNALGKAEP